MEKVSTSNSARGFVDFLLPFKFDCAFLLGGRLELLSPLNFSMEPLAKEGKEAVCMSSLLRSGTLRSCGFNLSVEILYITCVKEQTEFF